MNSSPPPAPPFVPPEPSPSDEDAGATKPVLAEQRSIPSLFGLRHRSLRANGTRVRVSVAKLAWLAHPAPDA
jgi:hypothetical protein